MRKKQVGLGVGLVLIAAAVSAWRCTATRRTNNAGTSGAAATASIQGTLGGVGAGSAKANARGGRPLPGWLANRGPARRIAGHVVRDGAPVQGATVTLRTPAAWAGLGEPEQRTSGADGAFDFGAQPSAAYIVTATAEGATGASERVDTGDLGRAPPVDRLVLRLTGCSAFVEGNVVDAAGNAVPHARVARNSDPSLATETDVRGAYKLCVPFGDVPIEYGADGYGAVTLVIDARGEVKRDVVLVPEAALVVRVVRAADDAPVPDARVAVNPKDWGNERPASHLAVTDADGRVRIEGLMPARYAVFALADGLQSATTTEALAEVGRDTEVVVKLDATGTVRGRVVSGDAPVAGVEISAACAAPAMRTAPVFTLADGTFELPRVLPCDVAFLVRGYEVEAPKHVTVTGGAEVDDVVVQVHGMATVRGRVTRLGKAVPDVEVCCVRSSDPGQQTHTDADGHYEFVGVPPGTYDVMGQHEQLGAFAVPKKVTVAAGETRDFDIELDLAGTIAGTVVDREGKAVRGVFVRWTHEQTGDVCRAITDAQGRYRCGTLTGGGRYHAAVFPSRDLQVPYPTADGAPYPSLELKDGATVLDHVVLAIDRPDLAIAGHVVDETGAPLADATVRAAFAPQGQQDAFQPWLRLPMTSTTEDGAFRIAELAPGSYTLQARAADGAEGVSPPVAAGATDAVIRIERPGSIEGTLVGFTQAPVVYARAVAGGSSALTAGTVDATRFRITSLRAGRYLVNANTGVEGDAREVEVTAGTVARVTLTSHGTGAIDGTVLDYRTRAPVANIRCHAVMAVGDHSAPTNFLPGAMPASDARGHLTIERAPAGSVMVECLPPSNTRSSPSAIVTLAQGGRASVELLTVALTQSNPSEIGAKLDLTSVVPRIVAVVPNSAAAKAGLAAGDVITAINGAPVQGLNAFGVWVLIVDTPVGQSVRITVQRGGETKTFAPIAASE